MTQIEDIPTMTAVEHAVEVFKRTDRAGDTGQWERADAIRIAVSAELPPGGRRGDGNDGSYAVIEQVKHAIQDAGVIEDINTETIAEYRNVAEAWPEDDRVKKASYGAHRELRGSAYDHNRVKLLERLVERSSRGYVTRADVRTYKSEMKPKKSTPWEQRFEQKLRSPFSGDIRPQAQSEWQTAVTLLKRLLAEAEEAVAHA